ncbi:MAG: hypothetical protein JWN30_513 [Bacilli bacterium]|nr:hypothetical protein [Bacilli bacterium]
MNTTFIYAILASLCYGIAPLFEKKGLQTAAATDSVLLRAALITAILFVYSAVRPRAMERISALDKTTLFIIFGGAIFGVLLAQLFYFKSLSTGNISQVVPLMTSMQMIISVTLAAIFYHEPLTLNRLGGIGLIMAGIYFIR